VEGGKGGFDIRGFKKNFFLLWIVALINRPIGDGGSSGEKKKEGTQSTPIMTEEDDVLIGI